MKKFITKCIENAKVFFKKTADFLKTNSQKAIIFSLLVASVGAIAFWYYYEQRKIVDAGRNGLFQLLENSVSSVSSSAKVKTVSDPFRQSSSEASRKKPQAKTEKSNDRFSSVRILISEVQIAGLLDSKGSFIELYNPNGRDIDLTGWHIQRKTKSGSTYSTFASKDLFSGKTITAQGYFLIARQEYFNDSADIFVNSPLTENNSLILKNSNGEIIDKIGWGQAKDYETAPAANPDLGQSIGRNQDEDDTDNNSVDFDKNIPTPKAENKLYVTPLPPPPTPSTLTISSQSKDLPPPLPLSPPSTTLPPSTIQPPPSLQSFPPPSPLPSSLPSPTPLPSNDNLAPNVVFNNLNATEKTLSFDISFTIIDSGGNAPSSGIASYIFRWKEESGSWNEDLMQNINGSPADFSGTKNFSGNDEETYSFQIKAADAAGNLSDWLPVDSTTTKISIFKKIIINEIQTYGKDSKNQFIELYNPSQVAVNLKGFVLKKKASTGKESNLVSSAAFSGTIPALGFFLIVPQSYSGSALPDLHYSGSSYSLAQKDNAVLLYNASGILLDQVGFGKVQGSVNPFTCPGETQCIPEGKSIERKQTGLDKSNNADDFQVLDNPTPQ